MRKGYFLLYACLYLLAQVGLGQHQVLVTFKSPKALTETLERVKSETNQKKSSVFEVRRFRSKRAQHIALITSDLSSQDWDAIDAVERTFKSDTKLTQRRTPNDPYLAEQWNFAQIDAEGAWEYTTGGATALGDEIVIGVIEINGYDLDHPELRNSYWRNNNEIAGNGIDDDNNGLIDDVNGWNYADNTNVFQSSAHGVHVSAVMRASTDNNQQAAGLVWGGSLLPYQVNNIEKWILALDQLTAYRENWNDSQGNQGLFIPVVNMSFGSDGADCDDSQDLQEAFERAGDAGILCVSAAGNTDGEITATFPDLPSTCPQDNLIVVTATDRSDEIWQDTRFSSVHVDLGAPGEIFQSVDYSGNRDTFKDTSGATPHVSGTVALMYSSDCEYLITLAHQQPALAATLVKEALLNGVDQVDGLTGKVFSDGRLNARKAIEQLLDDVCGNNALIIKLDENTSVDSTLVLASGETLQLERTLSQTWNIHLFNTTAEDITEALSDAISTPTIESAEPDIRLLLRSRIPSESGFEAQKFPVALGLPAGWGIVYGQAGSPIVSSEVVTALFDQNFDITDGNLEGRFEENLQEIPDNNIDDDNNGFIDDVIGVNISSRSQPFTQGRHGKAMSNLLAANVDDGQGISGVDWAGKVLPLQGNSLAQWIEGADYIANLRSVYNASSGNEGKLVVSYLIPQGGVRTLLSDQTTGVAETVISQLYDLGILAIGAMPNEIVDLNKDFPGGISHDGMLRVSGNRNAKTNLAALSSEELERIGFAPDENLIYDLSLNDTMRISGNSASAALIAGGVSLLYQVECSSTGLNPINAPRESAERASELILNQQKNSSDLSKRVTDIGFAVQTTALPCLQIERCELITPVQNPIPKGTNLTLNIANPELQKCPVQIVDALGRVVFEAEPQQNDLLNQVELSTDQWSTGVYYLSLGKDDAVAKPILVVK